MDTLSNIVKKTDFLGRKHSPTFKSQTSVRTCIGGLLSIVFCITVSIGVFFLGRELYERKTPVSNISESRQDINEIYLTDIQPIFSIIDATGKPLSKSKDFFESFNIVVMLLNPDVVGDGSLALNRIVIPFTNCSQSLLDDAHYSLLVSNKITIESYLCLDTSQILDLNGEKLNEPVVLKNTKSSVGGFSLRLEIKEISSQKEKKPFTIHLITKTGYLDITSYESPIKLALEEIHQQVFPGEDKELSLRYKINELKTDTGYIFSTDETKHYFSLDSTSKEMNHYSETEKKVVSITFDISMMRNVMNRKYLKLQQLIASTGGFIKAMTIILGFTLKAYSEVTLFNSINKEKLEIEGKTYILSKNGTMTNNFVQEKTISPVLKKSPPVIRRAGFCRYLRALLPFSRDNALKSDIRNTFAYFDVLTTIKLDYRVGILEQNFNGLFKNK